MNIIKSIFLIAVALSISGCASKSQPYLLKIENQNALTKSSIDPSSIEVGQFSEPTSFSAMCRLTVPIAAPEGETFASYIKNAFENELREAKLYARSGGKVKISADIRELSFSSTEALTNGNWNMVIDFKSTNGLSVTVRESFAFSSGYEGFSACNNTANAFGPAVGSMLTKLFRSRDFTSLAMVQK